MAIYREKHPDGSDDENKQVRKKRKTKDPNEPKKPCSAFFQFSKEMRPKIKEENPDLSFGDLGRKVGEAWRALNAEDKKPYESLAAEDKKRYTKEITAFKAKQKPSSSSSSDPSSTSDSSDSDSDDSSSDSD
eukprot:CAMPEP_0174256806 /NCGR_PEP_ID=MMETSP0439-20130205/6003_1 /TAXON_ID=0 /ORGANISM="Stereomyxa ramosa, Strain Chinc5" /LENGTH=131 /DNA_ID=CAMNT_0015339581 /DNA_START=384 /DNA_END=779 /DNA_ORIENTATION=-